MRDDTRLEQIQQARQRVLERGASATDALVGAWYDRAWLERSWRRCLAQGQRPEQSIGFNVVAPLARRRAEEAHRTLLAVVSQHVVPFEAQASDGRAVFGG